MEGKQFGQVSTLAGVVGDSYGRQDSYLEQSLAFVWCSVQDKLCSVQDKLCSVQDKLCSVHDKLCSATCDSQALGRFG